jgi:hypothetical protein
MHSGLSFDIVALRDIEEDEEIFIDYGEEWEAAWQEHVANFDAPRRGYMPAFEMNQQAELQIKTIHEADYEHMEGIYTFCRKTLIDLALGARDALAAEEELEAEVEDSNGEACYPCRVVHRNHNDSYIAELFVRKSTDHYTGLWEVDTDRVVYVLFDIPRDTFYFNDAVYKRDHAQLWSFRHDMRIPDEIFPDAWRDSLQRVVHGQAAGTTEDWLEDDYNDEDVRAYEEGKIPQQKERQPKKDEQDETKDSTEGESSYGHRKQGRKKVEAPTVPKPIGRQKDEEL